MEVLEYLSKIRATANQLPIAVKIGTEDGVDVFYDSKLDNFYKLVKGFYCDNPGHDYCNNCAFKEKKVIITELKKLDFK